MIAHQWNVSRLMLIGAVIGIIFAPFNAYIESPDTISNPAFLVGLAVGGGAGGAILFGIVATIRNLFVRS